MKSVCVQGLPSRRSCLRDWPEQEERGGVAEGALRWPTSSSEVAKSRPRRLLAASAIRPKSVV